MNLKNCTNISNVNHLRNLIELDASGGCGLNDDGIKDLQNLRILNASNITNAYARYGKYITNINHMKNLVELDAAGNYCCLSDDGIKGLTNLKKLKLSCNLKITDLNHLSKLTELIANENIILDNNSIKGLVNLQKMNLRNCTNISNINHLKHIT